SAHALHVVVGNTPVRIVGRILDLVLRRVRIFPVQHNRVEGRDGTEIYLDPGRIDSGRGAPAGGEVTVIHVARGEPAILVGAGGRRLVERQVDPRRGDRQGRRRARATAGGVSHDHRVVAGV